MPRRIDQPDTKADTELHACIETKPPRSFIMIAGAGSGKTTSLIKGLSRIVKVHGEHLRSRRQKIACITYTEIAAGEIWADVGNNPLVHVSTIHSFLWSMLKSFQTDIKKWVSVRIQEKLGELNEKAKTFGPRVQQKTREKNRRDITRYEDQAKRIGAVSYFTYGVGSDYANGILGHDDIIKIGTTFLTEKPLVRRLLAQQFPFLFVDESQDTFPDVVSGLKAVSLAHKESFCLGFFGDPMQQIYLTGIGNIIPEVGWEKITKPENFRCPTSVLAVSNSIRRDADGLVQTRGRTIENDGNHVTLAGTARFFIAKTTSDRDKTLASICEWVATENGDKEWLAPGSSAVKLLVIVHRMAARRLGFGDLYSALNDKAPERFKNGFLDASAWPLRPFISFLLPLVTASRSGNEFGVMQVLRAQSKQLQPENIRGKSVANVLATLKENVGHFRELMDEKSTAKIAQVLDSLVQTDLVEVDPRLTSYLTGRQVAELPREQAEESDGDELSKEIASMEAFLHCPANQLIPYFSYVQQQSPFSTQQGIKGAEFERVLVVLDDDEGTHVQFSYDKYFGLRELSEKEVENRREGKETSVERTRRLFYVCCTRAMKDLVVVYFVQDVGAAKERILALNLFPSEAVKVCEA
jgi:DNA helicase-2/ATP-dependent DNA helicase PcrA